MLACAALFSATSAGMARAQVGPGAPPSLPRLLQLRPDQRDAWRAYRDELAQERADAEADRHEVEQLNAMTTPQRLDWARADSPAREGRERRRAVAVLAFYEALLPDQRQRFDEVTREAPPPPPVRQHAARQAPASDFAGPAAGTLLASPPPAEDLPPPHSD